MRFLSIILGFFVFVGFLNVVFFIQIINFGFNLSGVCFYIYVFDRLVLNLVIIIVVYYCSGIVSVFYNGSLYVWLVDIYGFIVVYFELLNLGGCWDVFFNVVYICNSGVNSYVIVNMVNWIIECYGVDRNCVFFVGFSLGVMMINVFVVMYFDVFKVVSVYVGVFVGCFYIGIVVGWNNICVNGQLIMIQEYWVQIVCNMYFGYIGFRLKMMIYYGFVDDIIYFRVSFFYYFFFV